MSDIPDSTIIAENFIRSHRTTNWDFHLPKYWPQCFWCVHQNEEKPTTCTAFPLGMPDDILDGSFDHRKPHLNDGGITFSPVPNSKYNPDETLE